MTVSSACADFALGLKFEDIPTDALYWAKWGMLDCTGVGLAGSKVAVGAIVEDYLNFVGGKPQARVVGLGISTSATESAMANGALCHALDYDDCGGFGHPSTVLLPVVYALADLVKPSGKEAIAAYVAGYEVGDAMADRIIFGKIDTSSWDLGWHPTGPHGTIGATATAARLLGLTKQQTLCAFGIAASEASGIHKNFGTMTKPLHAGLAARNGVFAALLAQRGYTADVDALGGKGGFLRAFKGPGDYTEDLVCRRFGNEFTLSKGVAIKWYPGCWSTHRAVSSLIELMQENKLTAADIESVDVDFRPIPLLHFNPKTGYEGKFSMSFNLAVAALKGWPEIADYTDQRTQDAEVRAVMKRIRNVADPADGSVTLVINAKGGKRFERNRKHAPEDPSYGLQEGRIMEKFHNCASYRISAQESKQLADNLMNLEKVPDASVLLDLAAKPQRAAK